jgi:histidyl-tRNA synthetase
LLPQVYAVAVSDEQRDDLFIICEKLRDAGISVEIDHRCKSLKSQFKEANRSGARWAVVLGDSENENKQIVLKDMQQKTEQIIAQDDLVAVLKDV